MSHFAVLVVGNDIDKALAPFHEFECTGEDNQYVQDIDKTNEARASYEARGEDDKDQSFLDFSTEYYGYEELSIDKPLDREGAHKFGYVRVTDKGTAAEKVTVVRRTNPNRKWDWYVAGGRWSDYLLLKGGERADSALAGDVDWEAMIAESAKSAGELYDKVQAVVAGREYRLWPELLADCEAGKMDIDQAREAYHTQAVIQDLKKAEVLGWFSDPLPAIKGAESRESYVTLKAEEGARLYALLDADGKWHEPGEMGWFGMSSATDATKAQFCTEYWKAVRALPADTRVTCVDCHI